MEQLTGSKLGKENNKALYFHPGLFNLYAEYTIYEMPGWMNQKLESILSVEISATSDTQTVPL